MKWTRVDEILELETAIGKFAIWQGPLECCVVAPNRYIWDASFTNIEDAKAAVKRHLEEISRALTEGIQDEE